MSRHNNYSSSNQTTSINTHIDLLATEATLKQIQTSVSSISSGTSFVVSDTDTHTKLDTLNTTVADKHLNYETDSITVSEMPHLNFATDNVSVSEPVQSIPYDLELLGATLYADSVNFSVGTDPNGRDGWYGINTATTGGSNCYWYSNSTVPQNNMTKGQVECIYTVMALDRVQPAIVLPFVAVYSKPTGTGDIVPGFAHSRWVYTIPTTNILNAGEVVMLTIGDYTKVSNIQPEIRRVHLELSTETGECLDSEVVAYISLNTDSGLKTLYGIQYLLKNAGFFYSITQQAVNYVFSNSIDRKIKEVLLAGSGSGIDVNIVSGGGGGGGGLVQIQGYEGTGWANLTSTSGALHTTDSATTSLDGKVHNATEVDTDAIKVYTVNGGSSSSTIQAVLPSAPTVAVPLSATTYNDGTYDHYPLETYDNALNAKIFNATETDTEAIKVYTVNASGGGGGGLVQVQGFTTGTDYEDIHATLNGTTYSLDSNITNASLDVHCYGSSNGTDFHHLKTDANGQLQVEARAHDGAGNNISSTVVNTVRGLNVNVVGNSNLGTRGNVFTGTLTTLQITTAFAINNEYLNNCVLTYEDASTTQTSIINIQASVDGTNFVVIGTLQPANALSSRRTAFATLKLKAFTHIRIQSGASVSLTSVVCSLFSS
jgi:hypothetical protein